MKTLVLLPTRRSLRYSLLDTGLPEPVALAAGSCDACHPQSPSRTAAALAMDRLRESLHERGLERPPDLLAMRITFGGSALDLPVILDGRVRETLARQVPAAPLHLPGVLVLLDAVALEWPDVPIAIVSETAFFVSLPRREHLYALDSGLVTEQQVRRYGYHGIHHQAACTFAAARLPAGTCTPPRLLSIYLGTHPELAAVAGRRPVMVTSGATPLEGLPGETTCGQLDPGIVLALAESKGWGPEQIDQVLTTRSGLRGLVGHPITLPELLGDPTAGTELAREVIRYRLLLAGGSGMAAMGGLDAIVFSGPYADLGAQLGPQLAERLTFRSAGTSMRPPVICFGERLERLVADQALDALRHRPDRAASSAHATACACPR